MFFYIDENFTFVSLISPLEVEKEVQLTSSIRLSFISPLPFIYSMI